MAEDIEAAMHARRMLRFVYDDRPCVVEPHALGHKNGRLGILGYQVGGLCATGALPCWRRFHVDEMDAVEVLDDPFSARPLPEAMRDLWDKTSALVTP